MRPSRPALLAAAFVLLCAAPAAAQTLDGRVTDAADGTPVATAQVVALDDAGEVAAYTVSGNDGRYELRLPGPGAFRLRVSRIGFAQGISQPVTLAEGDRVSVDLGLGASSLVLDAVELRITPPFRDQRARGFYERMARGSGRFYTAEQIAGMNCSRTTDVLTYYAGVQMWNGKVWLGGDRRGCSPAIYIDGFRRREVNLDDALAPGDIWGVEIYQYAWQIPAALPRDDNGTCGIVMIWTLHS